MSRTDTTDDGDELLARLGMLTAQARERRPRCSAPGSSWPSPCSAACCPRDLPVARRLHLAVRYAPACHGLNVGGDWYDAFTLRDGRIGLSIGDVQGHNIEAAAFMGQVRAGLRALASVTGEPGEVLARTNDLLLSLGSRPVRHLHLHAPRPVRRGAGERAGRAHLPCIWATADGKSGLAEDEGGPPLGVQTGTPYPVTRYELTTGGVFVLLTDGVVEGPRCGSRRDWTR